VKKILAQRPEAVHVRDAHQRSALDAATLTDTFRICRNGFHAGHARTARVLIGGGTPIGLAHAASLGHIEAVRQALAAHPDEARGPVEVRATLGGTAVLESPLHAARRNGHAEVVEFLVKHGASEEPAIVWV